MKDNDFKLLGVLQTDGQTNKRTDICDCRVAFVTDKIVQNCKISNEAFFSNLISLLSHRQFPSMCTKYNLEAIYNKGKQDWTRIDKMIELADHPNMNSFLF